MKRLTCGYASSWAALPLRFVLGIGFVYHSFPKLFNEEGHSAFVGLLQQIGVPAAGFMAWVVGIVELLGGISLLLGAFVAVSTILLTLTMFVAMLTVHLPHGFNFMNIVETTAEGPVFGMPGYEVNLLYIAGLVGIFLLGAGRLSVDEQLERFLALERPEPLDVEEHAEVAVEGPPEAVAPHAE